MDKKIKFYLNKSTALKVSEKIDKFGLQLNIASNDTYTCEQMHQIVNQIKNNGIQITVNFPDKKSPLINKNYEKCGKCKYFNKEYGCGNGVARVKSKHLKTSNTKGCYWGEWN